MTQIMPGIVFVTLSDLKKAGFFCQWVIIQKSYMCSGITVNEGRKRLFPLFTMFQLRVLLVFIRIFPKKLIFRRVFSGQVKLQKKAFSSDTPVILRACASVSQQELRLAVVSARCCLCGARTRSQRARAGRAGIVWRRQHRGLSTQEGLQQTVAEMMEFRARTGLNMTAFAA